MGKHKILFDNRVKEKGFAVSFATPGEFLVLSSNHFAVSIKCLVCH